MSETPEEASPPRPGLFDSARRIVTTLLAIVHTRLELVTTELEEEVHRAAAFLLWAFVALLAGTLTVLMLALTIVIAWWEDRLLAAGVLTAIFGGTCVAAVLTLRARLKSRPRLLAATLEELKRDRAALGDEP